MGVEECAKCKGIKKNGEACRYRASVGDYCRIHSPVECPICYEEIKGKDAKVTSCKHSFHSECLQRWTRCNSTCPMCRTIIAPTAPERVKPPNLYVRRFSYTWDGRTYDHFGGSIFEVADY